MAKETYREGARRYAVGDFRGALEAFQRSYLAVEAPETLYNLAQCRRQLGDHAEAARLYRNYLDLLPSAPDRAEVEKLIVEQEQRASAAPTPPPVAAPKRATAAPPAKPAHRPTSKHVGLWVALGVGTAILAGALALGFTLGQPPANANDPTTTLGTKGASFH